VEIVAEALQLPLAGIDTLLLKSAKDVAFSSTCAAFGRAAAVTMRKEGKHKEDILNGLHESIANRAMTLFKKVGIADKFAISGGIGRSVGRSGDKDRSEARSLKVNLPAEPMMVGAVRAALFAADRARKRPANRRNGLPVNQQNEDAMQASLLSERARRSHRKGVEASQLASSCKSLIAGSPTRCIFAGLTAEFVHLHFPTRKDSSCIDALAH